MRTLIIQINLETLLVWAVVGLVGGFLASRMMLGHGLGLIGDVLVGIVGAVVGGFLADYFGVHLTVVGHPIVSEVVVAFIGALVLLLVLRLVGFGKGSRRGRRAL